MVWSRSQVVLLGALACGACQRSTQFGPEREVPLAHRPIEFGQSQRDRLGLQVPQAPTAADKGASYSATAPAHWQQQAPDPERFRDLRWAIGSGDGAECYLTARVGGALADNVARWCEQFGVPVLDAAAVAALPRHELLGDQAQLIELEGTFRGRSQMRMLLLARSRGGQLQSTFRLTGPKSLVEQERANFLAVAASVAVADPASIAAAPAGGAAPSGAAPSAGAAATAAPFAADVPAGWSAIGDTGARLLRHRFGAQGECYVGRLGGKVADMLGIWYGEIGQRAPDEAAIAALPRLQVLGGEALLVDLQGDFHGMGGAPIPAARLLMAVLADAGGVVYVKCVGPAAEVGAQREAFLAFCQSLRRSGA